MKNFSNSAAATEAKNLDWTWVADSYDTNWCRDKCKDLISSGVKAFYKKNRRQIHGLFLPVIAPRRKAPGSPGLELLTF